MVRFQKRKLSKKEEKAAKRVILSGDENNGRKENIIIEKKKRILAVPEVITVKDFSDKSDLPVTEVISVLIKNGVLATINETIDFETASIIGDDLGLSIVPEEKEGKKIALASPAEEPAGVSGANKKNLKHRSPVVTIMGHVDHGKTSLLDKIRLTNVAEGESGGITQHISAYQVVLDETKRKELKGRKITFIDTPGHAAFSSMREHGATITDIVVLIVAANDGVMPQTIEVINHAKENHVPIIVAINKVDLPDADVMRVKQQLSEYGLVPEDWGGKTIMVEVSAKTGHGINDLLEMILLQADLMELKANPDEKAIGVVIESRFMKGLGPIAVVLIDNGTLRMSDFVAVGSAYGRIRMMEDFSGHRITEAGPSVPVRIAGLRSLPSFGNRLIAFETEKEAKEASLRTDERVKSTMHIATAKRIENQTNENEIKVFELNLIAKSDVAGSLEALKKLLSEIHHPEINIKIVSEGVGPISESDVTLANATKSILYGFRVPVLMAAKKIAEKEGISIRNYDVIYKLIDDVKAEASKLLPPEIKEEELGRLNVLAIFRDDRKGFVAGGKLESGNLEIGNEVKVLQNDNDKYHDKITSLRHGKNEVKECSAGIECGIGLNPGAKVSVGDVIIAYKTTQKERTIG